MRENLTEDAVAGMGSVVSSGVGILVWIGVRLAGELWGLAAELPLFLCVRSECAIRDACYLAKR